MRKAALLLMIAVFVLFPPRAEAEGLPEELGAELDIGAIRDALPDELREIGGELGLRGNYDGGGALERLWQRFLDSARTSLLEESRTFFGILAVILLCALCAAFGSGPGSGETVEIAGCAILGLTLAGGVNSMVREAAAVLTELSDYGKVVLPVVYSTAAAGGAVTSAPTRYAIACLAMEAMMSASEQLFLPAISSYAAMAFCASIFDNPILRSALGLCKKLTVMGLSLMTAGFTAFLNLSGLVSGSADAAAVKAAKTVLSSTLPVVGGIMSDAAASVLAAASVVRNSAGAFALVAVCALCASPFAACAVRRILFRIMAGAAEMTSGRRMSRLLEDMGTVISLLLAMTGCFGLMLFVSIVSAIRAVTP